MANLLTIRDLYELARALKMEDATIRVCDGMAVHMFLTRDCVCTAPMEFVLDVSGLDAVDYDDLTDTERRINFFASELFSIVDNS